MALTDIQLDFIFRYFEGSLSGEEEEQLMEQLPHNRELQQAFDQEILLRHFEPKAINDLPAILNRRQQQDLFHPASGPVLEPADDFLKKVTGSLANKAPVAVKPAAVIKKKMNYGWVAAAAAVFICVLATVFYFQFKNTKGDNWVVNTPPKDTASLVQQQLPPFIDTARPVVPEQNLEQLYTDNNQLFSSVAVAGMIPPAATDYQNMYDQKKYQELVATSETELGFKGEGNRGEEERIENYFHFYKALANLQIGKTAIAEKLLEKLLNGNAGKKELGIHIKWYLLMVYLKSKNKQAAAAMAEKLTKDKRNPYYKQAVAIKEKLSP